MTTYSPIQEPTRNETVNIGVSSTLVSDPRTEANPRKVFVFRNISTADADIITLNLGFNPAVANEGIVLRKGESYGEATQQGFELWNGTINAICATANGILSVMER